MDNELYTEHILGLARSPHNQGALSDSTKVEVTNPICGDEMSLYIDFENNLVKEVSFESNSCAISCAGASITTDIIKNKSLQELKLITPGDIYTAFGVTIELNRTNCALLCYSALEKYLKNINKNESTASVLE